MSMLSTFTGCFRITLRAGRASWAPAAALLIAACACPAAAQDTDADTGQSWMTGSDASGKPRWSAEIMSGRFEPELEDWATFYGDDEMRQLGFGLGYKLLRQVEVGLAVDYMHDKGVGRLPLNDSFGGEVDFQLYPAHLYVLLRGVFFENQWVVPYVGGGLTRAYYRQAVDNQSSVRGKADGDHTRFGLQILLDALDGGNAAGFEEESVDNTYLVIERLSFSAEFDGIELGGDSVRLGLVFEF
jgi:opacity protein-like surface antigen